MDIYYWLYYCPYCGESPNYGQSLKDTVCRKCKKKVTMKQSKYPRKYYSKKSFDKYGDYLNIDEFLLPEMQENPDFDIDLYNDISQFKAENEKRLNEIFDKKEQNVPKCPTCGSTNVEPISSLKRTIHASLFGFYSKTVRSQFECQNCNYKW